jgi:hypothetical protein
LKAIYQLRNHQLSHRKSPMHQTLHAYHADNIDSYTQKSKSQHIQALKTSKEDTKVNCEEATKDS